MNKVFLIGNLTRDPELNETPSGVAVCRYSIAVGRNYTDANGERGTDFFNCVAWRGQAESIAKYCKKGNKVAVAGSIQLRKYTDNEGINRTAVDIITQEIEFLTPKAQDEPEEPRRKTPTLTPMDDDIDCPF